MPLEIFSGAMAFDPSLTVNTTQNCLLAAAGTFCKEYVQLSVLFISADQKDQYAAQRTVLEAAVQQGKVYDHNVDGEIVGLSPISIKQKRYKVFGGRGRGDNGA